MAIVASGSIEAYAQDVIHSMSVAPGSYTVVLTWVGVDWAELLTRMDTPPATGWGDFDTYGYGEDGTITTNLIVAPSQSVLYVAMYSNGAATWQLDVTLTAPYEVPILPLSADEKGQITFHLKQAGINFLPEMLTISYSLDELTLIRAALTRAGQAYDQTLLNYEIKLGVDQNQTVQDLQTEVVRPDSTTTTTYGDRTITNYRYLSYSQRVSAYHREVEQLAIALGVI